MRGVCVALVLLLLSVCGGALGVHVQVSALHAGLVTFKGNVTNASHLLTTIRLLLKSSMKCGLCSLVCKETSRQIS